MGVRGPATIHRDAQQSRTTTASPLAGPVNRYLGRFPSRNTTDVNTQLMGKASKTSVGHRDSAAPCSVASEKAACPSSVHRRWVILDSHGRNRRPICRPPAARPPSVHRVQRFRREESTARRARDRIRQAGLKSSLPASIASEPRKIRNHQRG